MDINPILSTLNDRSPGYEFGRLQDIRKELRPLKRRPSRHPFGPTTEPWAMHIGGRGELQFNVAEDEGLLRWGIAISLQPSRSLPDITGLLQKLHKLSSALETHGDHLHRLGFSMWDWTGDNLRNRSRNRPPQRVDDALYRPGAFTFVGKQAPFEAFDADLVLSDFDVLLPIYEFVEFERDGAPPVLYPKRDFVFEPELPSPIDDRPLATTATRTTGVSHVSLHHRALQDALRRDLIGEGVALRRESRDGRGGFIDLVACRDGEYEFYEVKTDADPRLAIRHAIGQLLEYAYWPTPVRPKRLVVVGEHSLDADASEYLRTLKSETGLCISYRRVDPLR